METARIILSFITIYQLKIVCGSCGVYTESEYYVYAVEVKFFNTASCRLLLPISRHAYAFLRCHVGAYVSQYGNSAGS